MEKIILCRSAVSFRLYALHTFNFHLWNQHHKMFCSAKALAVNQRLRQNDQDSGNTRRALRGKVEDPFPIEISAAHRWNSPEIIMLVWKIIEIHKRKIYSNYLKWLPSPQINIKRRSYLALKAHFCDFKCWWGFTFCVPLIQEHQLFTVWLQSGLFLYVCAHFFPETFENKSIWGNPMLQNICWEKDLLLYNRSKMIKTSSPTLVQHCCLIGVPCAKSIDCP